MESPFWPTPTKHRLARELKNAFWTVFSIGVLEKNAFQASEREGLGGTREHRIPGLAIRHAGGG